MRESAIENDGTENDPGVGTEGIEGTDQGPGKEGASEKAEKAEMEAVEAVEDAVRDQRIAVVIMNAVITEVARKRLPKDAERSLTNIGMYHLPDLST